MDAIVETVEQIDQPEIDQMDDETTKNVVETTDVVDTTDDQA